MGDGKPAVRNRPLKTKKAHFSLAVLPSKYGTLAALRRKQIPQQHPPVVDPLTGFTGMLKRHKRNDKLWRVWL